MKQLLYVAALIFVPCLADAQMTFPTSSTKWTVRHGNGEAPPDYYVYALQSEDTVISGLTYHKLYKSADMTFDESEYCGALREDATHKVYYMAADASTARMIYDFSMVVGDTLRSQTTPHTAEGIVDNIDTVTIDGIHHMRWNFRTMTAPVGTVWPGGAWIEGIGNSSLGGLLGSPMLQPTCDCAENIICNGDDAGWSYHNPLYASLDCLPSTAVARVSSQAMGAQVIPNPVTASARIVLTGALKGTAVHMRITDMAGRTVYDAGYAPGEEILLNSGKLHPGMYLYEITPENGTGVNGTFVAE